MRTGTLLRTALVACAMSAVALAAPAHAAANRPTASAGPTVQACQIGGAYTDFRGTGINIRATPGGRIVGQANRGDCAHYYRTDSGPPVDCPDGTSTVAWQLVLDLRTRVPGYVSACYV
ncbi:hypothetical protein GCM10010521_32200 [Streptomyces rameus]|uniref:Secreted protein n=1 Tax=Streptomyces rameus TaxID=68261 RepID=A0ABP6NBT5_9ACTN